MSNDRPKVGPEGRLREIFVQALNRQSIEDREHYLTEACDEDHELRALLTSLLQAHAQAGGFLESSPAGLDSKGTVPVSVQLLEKPGDKIGRYKLLQKIGEGGCGVVHMAEQEEPVRRRVALKILKLGMDTNSVIARFEAERQALAMMDHPNIAKVLDGGATDAGRPYFVMELVPGTKITEYCDQNSFTTRERLDLFIKVCQAIQHAHQKGIIHRDIKPSNILVTINDGVVVPKVIDFGIAKATEGRLTDKTLFTQFEALIGTPAYMSPEQAVMASLDIDTRSDIYSLGVLLYELLTGSTPFDEKELMESGIDAMRKTIREKEPVRPSTKLGRTLGASDAQAPQSSVSDESQKDIRASSRRRLQLRETIALLRGDLDWIVMKCLEKDRARRYETATGLANDLQRYLNNEAVLACPPSVTYKIQKFVRRNRAIVAGAGTIVAVLTLGIAVSTWAAMRATQAYREQSRLREAAQVAGEQEALERQRAEAQELAARQRAYSSDMTLAGQLLAANNLGFAQELLDRQRPQPGKSDLRGWEWRHLWNRTRSDERFALRGHANDVPIALFLHDGRMAFSGSSDHSLKFWDLEGRSVVETIPYPDDPHRAALSPDGRYLAVGGSFGYWSLWDVSSRRLLIDRTNATGVVGTTFSSTGRELAIADGLNIEIWRLPEQRLARRFPRRHPGGDDLGFVVGVAFSPDDKKIAFGHGDSRVLLRDLESGDETTIGRVAGIAYSLAFSPDGRALVSADRSRITVWDATGQLPSRQLAGHREQVVCVVFSPDGKLLASASSDQTIKLWDAQNWQEIRTLKGHQHEVHSVAFSRDGQSLISSGKDQTVRVWSVAREAGPSDCLVVSKTPHSDFGRPNGEQLLRLPFRGDTATLLDLGTLKESSPQPVPPVFRLARAVAVDRNSGLAAVALEEGLVEIWNTTPFSKVKVAARSEIPATAVALGETSHWLAIQRTNETTELWDLDRDQLVWRLEAMAAPVRGNQAYKGLSFWASDKRLVRATSAVRNIDAFLEIITIPEGKRCLISSRHSGVDILTNFALSEDGTLMATSGYDGRVRLFDALTGQEIEALGGQLIGFIGLAFSPDGSRLAAGGFDGTITLWDVMTRQRVGHWKAHEYPSAWLSFVHEGRAIASSGGDFTPVGFPLEIRLWRSPSWEEVDAAEMTDLRMR